MAGAVKHMKRSHRSYRASNSDVFTNFHRKAYAVKMEKESKKTFGQRLSGMFRKMLPDTSSK